MANRIRTPKRMTQDGLLELVKRLTLIKQMFSATDTDTDDPMVWLALSQDLSFLAADVATLSGYAASQVARLADNAKEGLSPRKGEQTTGNVLHFPNIKAS